jgi:hypothetical protein
MRTVPHLARGLSAGPESLWSMTRKKPKKTTEVRRPSDKLSEVDPEPLSAWGRGRPVKLPPSNRRHRSDGRMVNRVAQGVSADPSRRAYDDKP